MSYFPIVHYSKYYQTNDPRTLVKRAYQAEAFNKDSTPTLQHAQTVTLKHDLVSMRNRFVYVRSGDAAICTMPTSVQGEYASIFNWCTNTCMPESEPFRLLKWYITGTDSMEEIINRIAQEKGMNSKVAYILGCTEFSKQGGGNSVHPLGSEVAAPKLQLELRRF